MRELSRPPLDSEKAREKYGPWAVIAGGSDGSGEAYARALAELGLNLVLVARRPEPLEVLASHLRAAHDIEVRTLPLDLASPDAARTLIDAVATLEVGLYISNAGADSGGSRFFKQGVERWLRTIDMNVRTVTEAVHGFGNRMLARGRGGLIIMSSYAGLGGRPFLAMYSATKSFEMVLVEALWGELTQSNVDILGVIAPAMDTPFLRRSLGGNAKKLGDFVFDPSDVAREALANLGHQPLIMFPSNRHTEPEQVIKARYNNLVLTLETAKNFSHRTTR